MKKLLLFASLIMFFASCEEFDFCHKKEKQCATVDVESLPAAVSQAFTAKYPGITADKWFNTDNVGYAAFFTQNGNETLAYFANDGTFKNEALENQEGDHQDNNNDSGCECETGNENEDD